MLISRMAALAFVPLCLTATTPAANASTPGEWGKLFKSAAKACEQESGLKRARALGEPVDFEAKVLVIVEGRWPQKHMKNKLAHYACLYDKRAKSAEAHEVQTIRPDVR